MMKHALRPANISGAGSVPALPLAPHPALFSPLEVASMARRECPEFVRVRRRERRIPGPDDRHDHELVLWPGAEWQYRGDGGDRRGAACLYIPLAGWAVF